MAKKNEWIYRELLYQFIEKKNNHFTQLALAKKIGISISTVNNALKPLARMGAIEIKKMSFRIIDYKKIIYYWASIRNLEKDILYSTRVEATVSDIEKNIPPGAIYACFSAYKFKFEEVAADYSEIYIYASENELKEIKKRFPERKGPTNLIVLKSDNHLESLSEENITSIAQMFVDLWNLKTWYARDFVNALEKRINDVV